MTTESQNDEPLNGNDSEELLRIAQNQQAIIDVMVTEMAGRYPSPKLKAAVSRSAGLQQRIGRMVARVGARTVVPPLVEADPKVIEGGGPVAASKAPKKKSDKGAAKQ